MKEKKHIKISLKLGIIILCCTIIIILASMCFIISKFSKSYYINASEIRNVIPEITVYKPIIYLYPIKETEISVKLLKEESLTCSYPKYNSKWYVLANPNGDLKDLYTSRYLYSLYYENKSNIKFDMRRDGFIVKSEDVATFLEEKLSILGLNEREAEEFIIYWLPKLESNRYNYIRFATSDEINENMPLDIKPNPDTIIRVLMTYKGLEKPIEIKEQKLEAPERKRICSCRMGRS